MKRKLMALVLAVVTVFTFTACGGKDSKDEKKSGEIQIDGKAKLGQYKGIEVDSSLGQVSDEDLEAYMESVKNNAAVTEYASEGVVKEGDSVKLDLTTTVDGQEYANGSATDTVMTMVEGTIEVDGFIQGLIGHSIGETVVMNLTFPEDFSDSEVAGKQAEFKVVLKGIGVTTYPEINDEFVKENYGYLGLSTYDELVEFMKKDIILGQVYEDIWENVVMKNCTVESYDEDRLKEMVKTYSEQQEASIYSYLQMTLDEYLTETGMTKEEYDQQIEDMAKEDLSLEIIVLSIAKKEGITISDKEFDQYMERFAHQYGYDSVDEFRKAYSSTDDETFKLGIYASKVQELVCGSVKFVDGYGLRTDSGQEETSSEE